LKSKLNGFNPIWNTEFKFTLTSPELALLLFTVCDEGSGLVKKSDDFIGQYGIPVECMREGYRAVPLRDKKGNIFEKASLLVYVNFAAG
jgi:hypothetical protein